MNLQLPYLGRISAGPPTTPGDELDTVELFCSPDRYTLKVEGNDLIASDIRHGDTLVIKNTQHPKKNDIVVAYIDGRVVLRYYRYRDGRIELSTEDGHGVSYDPRRVAIQGVVVAQVRRH